MAHPTLLLGKLNAFCAVVVQLIALTGQLADVLVRSELGLKQAMNASAKLVISTQQ
jgi:hypothetical protein